MPDHSGFSLVEIMMVVMLIGLLAGMTGPPIFHYLEASQAQTSLDRLVADMQYARAVAVSKGETHRFSCTTGGYDLRNMVTGDVVRAVVLDHGMELNLAQTADFYPWGMAQTCNVTLTRNDLAWDLQLLPTGMVEVEVQ